MNNAKWIASLLLLLSLQACAATQASDEWVQAAEAQQLLQRQPDLKILDIRTPAEFQQGHLPSAQNLDFYSPDFASQLQALDPQQPYLMYCASGVRSAKAYQQMKALGFNTVYEIQGGYQAWSAGQFPVQTVE